MLDIKGENWALTAGFRKSMGHRVLRFDPSDQQLFEEIVRRICAKMEFADGASVAGYKHRLLLLLDEFTSLGMCW